VVVDDRRGGYVATAHLLSLGRRRVAAITEPADSLVGRLRLEGYQEALADWAQPADPVLVVEGRFDFESGYSAAERLLDADARPDGVVAANDLTAVGAIARLRERGVRVPEDVAVVGYDDSELGRLYHPPVTTIAQPKYDLGRRGVELLLGRIEGDGPAAAEVLDCQLLVRRSSLGRNGEVNCGSIAAEAPWGACLQDASPTTG
jgi:LacI family repressor for deo operon, udp, cdd, tsx, nupC, and nupG